jgi:predicted oxidoreductase
MMVTLKDGIEVSPVVPGMMRLNEWNLPPESLRGWLTECIEMGVTTFDLADIYGDYTNESRFGDALTPSLRDRMQIITKCGIMLRSHNRPDTVVKHYDTSYGHIVASVEASLRHLQTDRIDVLLIHRPDPLMDPDAVARAFDDLHRDGKVQHFGVSNFAPGQVDLLESRMDYPLVTNQVQFSVTHLEPLYDGTFDDCLRRRMTPMVWSPLGGGGVFDPQTDRDRELRFALDAVCLELEASIDQVALAWIMQHPAGPIPVLGTGKIERVRAALAASELTLSRQQWFTILEASAGHPVP